MAFRCKIKAKHNYKKIEAIEQKITSTGANALQEVLKNIRGYAIRLENGHNSAGILIELVDMSDNEIKGRIYTDKNVMPYALFEHYGTGTYAEMEHIGKTQHFIETGYEEWYIPVAKAKRSLNYPIVTFNNVSFYVAHGAKANHFMTDAEFKSRQTNAKLAVDEFNKMIKECCK